MMKDADHFAIHWDDPPAGPIVLAHERFDPPFFNIYLASALTGRTEEELRHDADTRAVITDVLEHYDYLGLFCQVYDPAKSSAPGSGHSSEEVYMLDHGQTASADLVVFFLNSPSLGVGLEAQIAADASTPRIIIRPHGECVSRMFLGAFNPTLADIEFENMQDLRKKLGNAIGDICGELYIHVPTRRGVMRDIAGCAMHRFIFTHRVFQDIPVEYLAKTTGIRLHWLTELERDPKRCATLTMIQIELIADVLDAEIKINKQGRIQMAPKETGSILDPVAKESLDTLHDYVSSREKPLSDDCVRTEWQRYYEENIEPVQEAARQQPTPLTGQDSEKRFRRPTLF